MRSIRKDPCLLDADAIDMLRGAIGSGYGKVRPALQDAGVCGAEHSRKAGNSLRSKACKGG